MITTCCIYNFYSFWNLFKLGIIIKYRNLILCKQVETTSNLLPCATLTSPVFKNPIMWTTLPLKKVSIKNRERYITELNKKKSKDFMKIIKMPAYIIYMVLHRVGTYCTRYIRFFI